MAKAMPKVGQIWKIRHSRKGSFTGKILKLSESSCDVEIVEGEATMASSGGNLEQGECLTMSRQMTTFLEKVS